MSPQAEITIPDTDEAQITIDPVTFKKGVLIQFYDTYSASWLTACEDYYASYGYKASHYVNGDDNVIHRLRYLDIQNLYGGAIESHTLNNTNYSTWGGTDQEFIDQQIIAHDTRLQGYGFNKIRAWGAVGDSPDTWPIINHAMLDADLYCVPILNIMMDEDISKQQALSNNWINLTNGVVFKSFPMDTVYPSYIEQYVKDLVEYADLTGQIVALHGHDISKVGAANAVDDTLLSWIVQYVYNNGMKFYTTKDLGGKLFPDLSNGLYIREMPFTLAFQVGVNTPIAPVAYQDYVGDIADDDFDSVWYYSDDVNGTNEVDSGHTNAKSIIPSLGDDGKWVRAIYRFQEGGVWSPYFTFRRYEIAP